ncbi:molecular chaperone [Vibrio diabolicus]|uniref:fimbrial biogenesis chaperone n=1 Tax=Vibrio diabolicus TaxID=50719 RepID=UPI002285DF84|nr:molecular chaperone [Vibrio diabolicus]MCZ0760623.1 molecular chaperone [Vibrio diabolicus]
MDLIIKRLVFVIIFLSTLASQAYANSLLIWPIYPKISSESNATSIWMVNQGTEDFYLQVRIFQWGQKDGQDTYAQQRQLIVTPPFVKIAPGAKQLIRILNQDGALSNKEYAYRIIIDELPPAKGPKDENKENDLAVKVRMRYSIPLFMYGKGMKRQSQGTNEVWSGLQAKIIKSKDKNLIHIENTSNHYVRLVNLAVTAPNQSPFIVSKGLAGYILPEQYKTWPISYSNMKNIKVKADIEGKRYVIPLEQNE